MTDASPTGMSASKSPSGRRRPTWSDQATAQTAFGEWVEATIPAKTEGKLPVVLELPASVKPGRYPVAVDIRYDPWELPRFAHAMVVVE